MAHRVELKLRASDEAIINSNADWPSPLAVGGSSLAEHLPIVIILITEKNKINSTDAKQRQDRGSEVR